MINKQKPPTPAEAAAMYLDWLTDDLTHSMSVYEWAQLARYAYDMQPTEDYIEQVQIEIDLIRHAPTAIAKARALLSGRTVSNLTDNDLDALRRALVR